MFFFCKKNKKIRNRNWSRLLFLTSDTEPVLPHGFTNYMTKQFFFIPTIYTFIELQHIFFE
jgi:hypothetical protein